MILIADSGSTKCAWAECSTNGNIVKIHYTVGFNPKFTNYNNLINELKSSSLLAIKDQISEINFYGAGCSSKKANDKLQRYMARFFVNATINIMHDLEAAVKACYKGSPIICSILGTGSNSCIYSGDEIIENGLSLGYILGDEGSGNYFGKQLINLYVNKRLPQHLIESFENWTNDREVKIIENIYSLEKPNLYIASFFPFMYQHKNEPIFDIIFKQGIEHFFELHVKCFDNFRNYKLTFTGSVAFYLSDYIHTCAKKEQMEVQEIIQSPIRNLVTEYFKSK
ncbi:MAG: N-acetylglucosamine kinase [Flavobacteriales bacterium]|nr:N-acetylglucosamine kinase [Flavobacteriales bacterium]|tara:strand:+ start:6504 stop:7349 length:846 start_codon:yes stop_codon:yes gene_type:complete